MAIGFAAASLGKPFRLYSVATAAVILVFSVLTSTQATKLETGAEPTPGWDSTNASSSGHC